LGLSQMLMWFPILILAFSAISAYRLKNQIWCTFRRRDRTKIEKFAKQGQNRIEFDGGWYHVRPERTTLIMWTKGIHAIVPTWVRSLDYRHDSALPLDPNTFSNTWETPEARKNLNKQEDISAFFQGNRTALVGKTKQGMLERLVPILTIAGFLIVGYMLWRQQGQIDQVGFGINTIQKMIMDYAAK